MGRPKKSNLNENEPGVGKKSTNNYRKQLYFILDDSLRILRKSLENIQKLKDTYEDISAHKSDSKLANKLPKITQLTQTNRHEAKSSASEVKSNLKSKHRINAKIGKVEKQVDKQVNELFKQYESIRKQRGPKSSKSTAHLCDQLKILSLETLGKVADKIGLKTYGSKPTIIARIVNSLDRQ